MKKFWIQQVDKDLSQFSKDMLASVMQLKRDDSQGAISGNSRNQSSNKQLMSKKQSFNNIINAPNSQSRAGGNNTNHQASTNQANPDIKVINR